MAHSSSIVAVIVASAGLVLSCSRESPSTRATGPIGPVAETVAEAWPNRPTGVPILTREEIASACARHVLCVDAPRDNPAEGVGACVGQIEFSAERAIPLSALDPIWERPEYFVHCVLDAVDCAAVLECRHARDGHIYCEEDGCRPADGVKYEVTCDGDRALLDDGTATVERDCRVAFAQCDPDSPTGCTDRPFSACGKDDGGDRCEGNVRLGCDSNGQVSYRDCERLGGTCIEADGGARCTYGQSDAECSGGNFIFSHCEGENVVTCVAAQRVSVPAPDLCAPAAE